MVDPAAAAAVLADHERHHTDRLQFYRQVLPELEAAWEADGGGLGSPYFSGVALVRRGVGYEREYSQWVLDRLRAPR